MLKVLDATQETEDLFQFTSGPHDARLILVGEAWGAEEHSAQRPFVGTSGKELDRILSDAGLRRGDILCTNLIHARPPSNDFTTFLNPTPTKGKKNGTALVDFRGIYPQSALLAGYRNLHSLIARVDPLVVIAAGNWPLWALTSHSEPKTTRGFKLPTGIAKWRGSQTFTISPHSDRRWPCLPIIHPAAILREWGWRQITVRDLQRAAAYVAASRPRERSAGSWPGWSPPAQTFTLHTPSFNQVRDRLRLWRDQADTHRSAGRSDCLRLAVDLETSRRRYISVVGIADSNVELCIGLFTRVNGTTANRYTLREECLIWRELKRLLEHPNVEIIGQNFIYDTEWLYRYYNINALVSFDTMVAHHLLFPGTPKRLDYLASLYCSHFTYWKDESWDFDGDVGEHTWRYNCKDLRATYEIADVLRGVLERNPEMNQLYHERIEQWHLAREMTLKGTNFDLNLQRKYRLDLMQDAEETSTWLQKAVPPKWRYTSTGIPWHDSPKSTADLFYTCLGLNPVRHKKTKLPTTDDSALAELSERPEAAWLEPLFTRLRHLRSVGVFTRNFMAAAVSADQRIRPTFNIAHPETFRWSSNRNGFGEGLNGQNIPKGDKEVPTDEQEPGDNFFASNDPDI